MDHIIASALLVTCFFPTEVRNTFYFSLNASQNGWKCAIECNFVLEECVDMRKEQCYMEYVDGTCAHPMSNHQTKMVCCCSMGEAWGNPCEPCPRPRSSTLYIYYTLFFNGKF